MASTSRGFNSRTLGRVRQRNIPIVGAWEKCFNSRTLGRVRRLRRSRSAVAISFNSRTLGRVRPRSGHRPGCAGCFNSRTLGRVRPTMQYHYGKVDEFQFTHPGKGATRKCQSVTTNHRVSIHAPWEGCDHSIPRISRLVISFNSRTLGRVRQERERHPVSPIRRFNSRTLGRVRLVFRKSVKTNEKFQFTHPGKGATVRSRTARH